MNLDKIILHPWLTAIAPILLLWSSNMDMVTVQTPLKICLFMLLVAFLFFCVGNFIYKNQRQTAIIITLTFLLIFSFGHLHRFLGAALPNNFSYADRYPLAFIWLILFVLLIIRPIRNNNHLKSLTKFFNITSVLLIVVPIQQIITYAPTREASPTASLPSNNSSEIINKPDIYLLVFDSHARTDVLEKYYNYSNQPFIDALRQRGMIVADHSTTNYNQTYFSIAALLNLDYVQNIIDQTDVKVTDRTPMIKIIQDSLVEKFLSALNYKMIGFSSGWAGSDHLSNYEYRYKSALDLDEFSNVLLITTPFYLLTGTNYQYDLHAKKIIKSFEKIPEIAKDPNPTFTYAHFLTPHPPFIFDQDGNLVDQWAPFALHDLNWISSGLGTTEDYVKLYSAQLTYIDKQILNLIDNILANSDRTPIIILQSDHGPAAYYSYDELTDISIQERTPILNAYLLPDQNANLIYDSITPVNSFRTIFNAYFNTNYDLLEDKNYYSPHLKPYQLIEITDSVDNQN